MGPWIQPVTLTGNIVVLEPLALEHVDALEEAVTDGELWELWYTLIPRPDKMLGYVETALALRAAGTAMPFVVRHREWDEIVGTTRYLNVEPLHRRLEIGATWYAKRVQRTALNTEVKLLLLTHAFERLDAIAVEFRTHYMNLASRTAIQRLGAKQDGILRNHQIAPDGSYRDTVVFSILESEWPAVRNNLRFRLEHGAI
jgi:N-acetyltransferase